MPYAPRNTKCQMLGCTNQRSRYSTMCVAHGGKDQQTYHPNETRRKNNAVYQTAQWQRLRMRQLSAQPLCAGCLASHRVTQATEVDHVFPWKQIGKQAFYRNVFQSLCHDCHSAKTQMERKGICRHYHSQTYVDYNIADYSMKVPT